MIGVLQKKDDARCARMLVLLAFTGAACWWLQAPAAAGLWRPVRHRCLRALREIADPGRRRADARCCRWISTKQRHIARFEFPVLMLFSTVGMMMMASANNLMTLYMGLELQSLAIYVLAAFARDDCGPPRPG